LGRDKRWSKRS